MGGIIESIINALVGFMDGILRAITGGGDE